METSQKMIGIILLLSCSELLLGQKGVVIVPVADLVGAPLLPTSSYDTLAWSCKRGDYEASPRVHQLLFNEVIEIKEARGDELRIQVPNIYYTSTRNSRPQTSYWTHKKNIMPCDQLSPHQRSLLPLPIQFDKRDNSRAYRNTIALIIPVRDSETGMIFSAGTRFIKTPTQTQKNESEYSVYCVRPKSKATMLTIAKKDCYEYRPKSRPQIIQDYVAILRAWANHAKGFIPYVLGGSSFTTSHTNNQFVLAKTMRNNKALHFYKRPYYKEPVKTGFDCSGIIARAAQLAGIPYHLKNTYTIRQQLKPVGPNGKVSSGDIIWFNGHVLVVVDVSKNTVVEANSYDGKFGIIHEKRLGQIFKGIHTIEKLQKVCREKKSLGRLNADGDITISYKTFELLKIESAWDTV